MKIDLAVWTAVNGYDWQPGNVYSPKELAGYKDEIGPLVPDSLPVGGLFLKNGKVIFYRVQIAERMDSRGRGAIYCVLGTVPEDKAKEIDFAVVFNSPELAQPQKPFPVSLECREEPRDYKSPLGMAQCDERRFTGVETFSELGGWCDEAKRGELSVRITGSMESPLFTVKYKPYAEPAPAPRKTQQEQVSRSVAEYRLPPRSTPYKHEPAGASDIDDYNPRFDYTENSAMRHGNVFALGFIAGTFFGAVATALSVWLLWPGKSAAPMETGLVPMSSAGQRRPAIDEELRTEARRDAIKEIKATQEESAKPAEERPTMRICPSCGGVGRIGDHRSGTAFPRGVVLRCSRCGGTGQIEILNSREEP